MPTIVMPGDRIVLPGGSTIPIEGDRDAIRFLNTVGDVLARNGFHVAYGVICRG